MIDKLWRKIEIRFHKLSRYCYRGFVNPSLKKKILLNDNNSYFDPFVINHHDSVSIVCSERNTDSIVLFNLADLTKKSVLLKPIVGTWEEKVNRACIVFYCNKYYMWYTGQTKKDSCIGLAISDDGSTFIRHSKSPVLLPSLQLEKSAVMNPSVIFDQQNNIFKMWYSAGDLYEPDYIFYAESTDGIVWKKRNEPVLTKSKNKYDCYKVGGCDVHKTEDGMYEMYYIGYQNLDVARICRAVSSDGITWNRDKNNPFICPSRGLWDSDSCYKPSYFYDKKSSNEYVFYNGRRKNIEQIGYITINGEKPYEKI